MAKQYSMTAIIYDRRGNILSIGKNSYVKSHPLMAHYAEKCGEPYKIYLHSEVDAIIKCKDIDKAYRIAIFRYLEDGTPAIAMPCKICRQAISKTKIQVVEHT